MKLELKGFDYLHICVYSLKFSVLRLSQRQIGAKDLTYGSVCILVTHNERVLALVGETLLLVVCYQRMFCLVLDKVAHGYASSPLEESSHPLI